MRLGAIASITLVWIYILADIFDGARNHWVRYTNMESLLIAAYMAAMVLSLVCGLALLGKDWANRELAHLSLTTFGFGLLELVFIFHYSEA